MSAFVVVKLLLNVNIHLLKERDRIMDMFISLHKYYVYGLVVVIFISILFTKHVISKRKRKKEIESLVQDKLREQQLDQYIMNQAAPRVEYAQSSAKPFEEDYDAKSAKSGSKTSSDKPHVMLQIQEIREISTKKYILDARNGVYIGRDPKKNNIVVSDSGVCDIQCVIKSRDRLIIIKNIGDYGEVLLKRRRTTMKISDVPIQLKTRDAILIGKTELKIYFLKA